MARQFIMHFQTGTFRIRESPKRREAMKLHYYPETDSLYIDLNARPSTDSREITEGLVADFDAAGNIVGIDIQHASTVMDLKVIETESLPMVSAKTA
jgi:uncharacterized protein YuzE